MLDLILLALGGIALYAVMFAGAYVVVALDAFLTGEED